jgi:uncharacterized protein YutE (UPF0331/DUF86 family)
MRLGELKNIETVIVKLMSAELPIRLAFKFGVVVEQINDNLRRLEEFRVNLVKKYGKTDNKGNLQVLPENMDKFTDELKELLDTEVDIKIVKIPIEVFEKGDIKVSIKEINSLVKAGFIDKQELDKWQK